MKILFDNPDQQLTDLAFQNDRYRATVFLELTTMKGDIRRVAREVNMGVPNDRNTLPTEPTLFDLVQLVLKRQHPVMQYIAEQNGVKVHVHLHALPRRLWNIEYDSSGMACRLYL